MTSKVNTVVAVSFYEMEDTRKQGGGAHEHIREDCVSCRIGPDVLEKVTARVPQVCVARPICDGHKLIAAPYIGSNKNWFIHYVCVGVL